MPQNWRKSEISEGGNRDYTLSHVLSLGTFCLRPPKGRVVRPQALTEPLYYLLPTSDLYPRKLRKGRFWITCGVTYL